MARDLPPIPDLIAHEAEVRVDFAFVREMLVFAFATGGSPEAFDEALERASLPASSWDRAQFSRDLFLGDLIDRAMPVRIGARTFRAGRGYLANVLTSPPKDPAARAFRQAILAELGSSDARRRDLEAVYGEIVTLRTLLATGTAGVGWLRRLEILRALHRTIARIAESFDGATSGLARVRAFGEAVAASGPYQKLEGLLDHEGHLGTVDVQLRVGADGEIRRFQILAVRENKANPFHESVIGRLWSRLRLLVRGYRMSGGEVIERLFDDVFTGLEGALVLLVQLGGDLEVHLACLGLRDLAHEHGLEVSLADMTPIAEDERRSVALEGLWNPLLLGGKRAPVPCSIETSRREGVTIVTGPNSGGKTRLVQAIGIAALLGQGGFYAPASRARLASISGLFVSLVEESRADQPEGQLGMELRRIRRMFEEIEHGSLVLLDELCSGTNPSEGEEIARLVLSLLPRLGARVFVTTHLLDFATRLAAEQGASANDPRAASDASAWIAELEFLQVELDARDRPTYGFVPGVAKTSLAHKTAERLGVTRDELTELIAHKKRPASSPSDQLQAARQAPAATSQNSRWI